MVQQPLILKIALWYMDLTVVFVNVIQICIFYLPFSTCNKEICFCIFLGLLCLFNNFH